MRIIQIFLFLITISLLFLVSDVNAFTISPLKHNITVLQGNSGQFVYIEVKNDAKTDQNFQLEVLDVKQKNNGQLIFSAQDNELEKWVESKNKNIEIKAGETKKVEFLIKVPKGVESGDYYFGLAAGAIGKDKNDVVGVLGQLVTILELHVAGIVNESLSISDVKIQSIAFLKKWSIVFSLDNNSQVDLPIKGSVFIRDATGKGVYKKDINFGKNLLPKSSRSYTVDIVLPDQEFYIPGLYNAELTVDYGITNQFITATYSIWFLPFYALVAGIILSIAIILSIFYKKRFNV